MAQSPLRPASSPKIYPHFPSTLWLKALGTTLARTRATASFTKVSRPLIRGGLPRRVGCRVPRPSSTHQSSLPPSQNGQTLERRTTILQQQLSLHLVPYQLSRKRPPGTTPFPRHQKTPFPWNSSSATGDLSRVLRCNPASRLAPTARQPRRRVEFACLVPRYRLFSAHPCRTTGKLSRSLRPGSDPLQLLPRPRSSHRLQSPPRRSHLLHLPDAPRLSLSRSHHTRHRSSVLPSRSPTASSSQALQSTSTGAASLDAPSSSHHYATFPI